MEESQRLALNEISLAGEDIVDGIRIIRDSIITVEAGEEGGLLMTSTLLKGKTVNEAAKALAEAFEGKVPAESGRLAQELIHTDDESGGLQAQFMDIHWQLDSAVSEWEQVQKNTVFIEDPDSE